MAVELRFSNGDISSYEIHVTSYGIGDTAEIVLSAYRDDIDIGDSVRAFIPMYMTTGSGTVFGDTRVFEGVVREIVVSEKPVIRVDGLFKIAMSKRIHLSGTYTRRDAIDEILRLTGISGYGAVYVTRDDSVFDEELELDVKGKAYEVLDYVLPNNYLAVFDYTNMKTVIRQYNTIGYTNWNPYGVTGVAEVVPLLISYTSAEYRFGVYRSSSTGVLGDALKHTEFNVRTVKLHISNAERLDSTWSSYTFNGIPMFVSMSSAILWQYAPIVRMNGGNMTDAIWFLGVDVDRKEDVNFYVYTGVDADMFLYNMNPAAVTKYVWMPANTIYGNRYVITENVVEEKRATQYRLPRFTWAINMPVGAAGTAVDSYIEFVPYGTHYVNDVGDTGYYDYMVLELNTFLSASGDKVGAEYWFRKLEMGNKKDIWYYYELVNDAGTVKIRLGSRDEYGTEIGTADEYAIDLTGAEALFIRVLFSYDGHTVVDVYAAGSSSNTIWHIGSFERTSAGEDEEIGSMAVLKKVRVYAHTDSYADSYVSIYEVGRYAEVMSEENLRQSTDIMISSLPPYHTAVTLDAKYQAGTAYVVDGTNMEIIDRYWIQKLGRKEVHVSLGKTYSLADVVWYGKIGVEARVYMRKPVLYDVYGETDYIYDLSYGVFVSDSVDVGLPEPVVLYAAVNIGLPVILYTPMFRRYVLARIYKLVFKDYIVLVEATTGKKGLVY